MSTREVPDEFCLSDEAWGELCRHEGLAGVTREEFERELFLEALEDALGDSPSARMETYALLKGRGIL